MNLDRLIQAFSRHRVEAILIGDLERSLRRRADLDFWIRDDVLNLHRAAWSMLDLGADWSPDGKSWGRVPLGCDWLLSHPIAHLTTRRGGVTLYRQVPGLEGAFDECWLRSVENRTMDGITFRSLADSDRGRCRLGQPFFTGHGFPVGPKLGEIFGTRAL